MDLEQFEAAIKPGKTSLASVMSVNNEIGVVQPIKEIGELCRKHKVIYLVVVLVHFEKGKTRQIRDMHELLFTRCFFNYYSLDVFLIFIFLMNFLYRYFFIRMRLRLLAKFL